MRTGRKLRALHSNPSRPTVAGVQTMNAATAGAQTRAAASSDSLVIAGRAYQSRLLVGTGKYKDFAQTRRAIDASGAEIVTVAIRRTNIGQNAGEPNLLEELPPARFAILPNTAGCYT